MVVTVGKRSIAVAVNWRVEIQQMVVEISVLGQHQPQAIAEHTVQIRNFESQRWTEVVMGILVLFETRD